MRSLPVALTSMLLALCLIAQAARGPVCDRKHHHPRAIHTADHCAHSLHAPKVALLFLTRGPLPLEPVWRRWFLEIAGLAYTGCADGDNDHVQKCGREREADPIAQQHMYTVQQPMLSALTYARTMLSLLACVLCSQRHARCAWPSLFFWRQERKLFKVLLALLACPAMVQR